MTDLTELDEWEPPRGPCAFCGHSDERHRLWDTWLDLAAAGATAENISREYQEPVEYVEAVLRLRPYQVEQGAGQ